MPIFLWTPFSISFLVQLLLGAMCTGYLVFRLGREHQNGNVLLSTLAISAGAFSLTCFLFLNFLQATLHPDLASHALPWEAPFGALALLSTILFAYHYPDRLIRLQSIEAFIIGTMGLFYLASEIWVAVGRVNSQVMGFIEYRPGFLDIIQLMAALWVLVVLFRQYWRAIQQHKSGGVPLTACLGRLLTGNALSADASAVRAFFLVSLIPAFAILLLTLRSYRILDGIVTEIGLCWLMLLVLTGFSLVYLNYVPERSSFLTKIAGITLTIILAILCSVSWIIGGVYSDAYPNDRIPQSGTAIRFQPGSNNSYFVSNTAFRFDENLGERQAGPYVRDIGLTFPFYGAERDRLFVDPIGIISFEIQPSVRHVMDRFGGTGAIFPLILDTAFQVDPPAGSGELADEPQSGIYFREDEGRILLTWYKVVGGAHLDEVYTYQIALYPNGVIEIAYQSVPDTVHANVMAPLTSPMLAGITPGRLNGAVDRVSFKSDLPLEGKPMTGLVDDYRLDFLMYLNRIYAPVAAFTLLMTLVVAGFIPLIFQRSLVRPLNNLLDGVQSFLRGKYSGSIRIFYKDEIGYLTQVFGDLADAQIELVQSLEDQVAARTRSAVTLAEKNARLEERNHLSGELHDAVSQKLFTSTLIADKLSAAVGKADTTTEMALAEICNLNRAALAEMRMLMTELRPARGTHEAFGPVLKDLVKSLTPPHEFDVQLQIENDARLPDNIFKVFYRVAQESLNNIVKHARAKTVRIVFDALPYQSIFSISDDGEGFDLDNVPAGHLGVEIMRERVQKIGGHLEISSVPGQGTSLTLIWYEGDAE